jgi:hypothetical protein
MESAFAALHSTQKQKVSVSFEIGSTKTGEIGLFVRGNAEILRLMESQIYSQYPESDIEYLDDDPFSTDENTGVMYSEISLNNPEVFPIKRHPQFDDMLTKANVDSLASITGTLARYPFPGMQGHIQLLLQPAHNTVRQSFIKTLPLWAKDSKLAHLLATLKLSKGLKWWLTLPLQLVLGFFFRKAKVPSGNNGKPKPEEEDDVMGGQASSRSHDRETSIMGAQDKLGRLLFKTTIRVAVLYPKGKPELAREKLSEIIGSYRQFALPESNSFVSSSFKEVEKLQFNPAIKPFILSVEEIATLWHIPTLLVQTPNILRVDSRKLEPPINLPTTDGGDKEVTTLGEAVFRGQRIKFGIRPVDRRRHFYAIGKTGMGKSTLLGNMIASDIVNGHGVGVLDPHGDLIEDAMSFVTPEREDDILLFDPTDTNFPIAFNILDCPDPEQRTLVASGLMSVFTKIWPDAWSGRMEHILRNTILALLHHQNSSILGIMRIFADSTYRKEVVASVDDPVVRSFWEDEYEVWTEKYRTEAVAAIQNKVGQLLSTPLFRNIVGQTKSTVNLREAMDNGKIVLVNLSKGKIGEDISAFLGSMLVTQFQLSAMSRADIPQDDRRDFYLYVDEFQNYATESFATILSEARKYRLCLTMAHQYVGQLESDLVRDAVFGNVGSIVSFQIGSDDAELLSKQFEELVLPNDLLSLPKYHAYTRLMVEGTASKPFSVSTLPPPAPIAGGNVERLRAISRTRYSKPKEEVQGNILAWAQGASEQRVKEKEESKAKEKVEEEKKKARKKGMNLDQYRRWRDREMYINQYNALRKKIIIGEALTTEETAQKADLELRLEANGGVPELSKGLLKIKEDLENLKQMEG